MDVFLLLNGQQVRLMCKFCQLLFMGSSIDADTVFIIIQIVIVFMLIPGLPLAKGAQNRMAI